MTSDLAQKMKYYEKVIVSHSKLIYESISRVLVKYVIAAVFDKIIFSSMPTRMHTAHNFDEQLTNRNELH